MAENIKERVKLQADIGPGKREGMASLVEMMVTKATSMKMAVMEATRWRWHWPKGRCAWWRRLPFLLLVFALLIPSRSFWSNNGGVVILSWMNEGLMPAARVEGVYKGLLRLSFVDVTSFSLLCPHATSFFFFFF